LGFQKVRHDAGENIVRIKIEDETRRIIDTWVLMISDLPKWFKSIKEKYGLTSEKQQKDLEWIRWFFNLVIIDI